MRQDNAEGSPGPRHTKLSHRQQSVLVGTLLGDGCLAKHGRHHRLHVKHKAAHRVLAEFKYAVLRDFISMPLHVFDQILGGRRYPCVQFATRTHAVFSEWHSRFYREGRKVVPRDIDCFLSPLALAVWIMDDGAADYAGMTLQTHSFEMGEVQLLRTVISERFGLGVNLRRNKEAWILYVNAASIGRLRRIVEPHLLARFAYKLVPRRLVTP